MTGSGAQTQPASGVLVIGRADFATGIGRVTSAALELFSRYYDVSFLPTRADPREIGPHVDLPNGRSIPVVDDTEGFVVYFFTDVLWNGVDDFNYLSVPTNGIRVAHMAWDSDDLPPEWVQILNERFDVALFSSSHLEAVARASGVRIPVAALAIGLDIEELIARPYSPPARGFTRFGTVSAFHERKGLDILVEAFIDRFAGRTDVELSIHSNLAIGQTHSRVLALIDKAPWARITLSYGELSEAEKNDLLDSFDVFVSASSGEGYSIGPREALALGKPTVLSAIPAHRELGDTPGVFLVKTAGQRPARYPEIDNRVFGMSAIIDPVALGSALESAIEYLGDATMTDSAIRKRRAADFSLTSLSPVYAALLDPNFVTEARAVRRVDSSASPSPVADLVATTNERFARNLGARRVVVPMHDGGFFSIFNVFMSHLVWSLRDDRIAMVLPDWDAARLLERATEPIKSYCYSQPTDGNMWLSLFEPLYGLADDDLNDPDFLYSGAEIPVDQFNAAREPNLTYVHAFELYRSPTFQRFRNQYNSAVKDHVRLRPQLRREIDEALEARLGGRFTVSVHVKHPSHAVEQPDQNMAGINEYAAAVREALANGGIAEASDDWRVFVATDQDRVIQDFEYRFGDHVVRFDDVARVSAAEHAKYDSLDSLEKMREGHQLQHLVSANVSQWSTRLAWEVWRDAEFMAASNVLIHAVSNVATAASYLGPSSLMVFCEPDRPD